MTAKSSTILVVDDDEDVLLVASSYLRDQGFTILEATSGVEGLSILRDRDGIDLLFTDIAMPGGMDGFELAHRARQIRPTLRVLYTSGYVKDVPRDRALMSYGKLLPKPWRLASLDEAVRLALS